MGIALTVGVVAFGNGIRPVRDHRSINGLQTNELPAAWIGHMIPLLRTFAEEVLFLLRDRPVEAQILRDDGPVSLVTDHDKALFGPHHVQRFGTVWHDVELGTRLHQRIPERTALARRHGNLVRQLAREGNPIGAGVKVADLAVFPLHKGKTLFRDIHVAAELLDHLAGVGAHNRDLSVLLGHVGGIDFPVPPLALQPVFHPAVDALGPAGGGVAEKRVFVDPGNNTIVDEKAVFRTHQTIAAFAGFQRRHHIGVHHVHELAGIRALDDDLAQRRRIQHAHRVAGLVDLARHRIRMAFPIAREAIRATPMPHRLKEGLLVFVILVDRGPAQRLEHLIACFPRNRPERNRRIGRTEGRGAHSRDRRVQLTCQRGETVDVRQFALIGGHAQRGVTLGVFNRLVALLRRQTHVRDFHVVLIVQPRLDTQRRACPLRHQPDGFHGRLGCRGRNRRRFLWRVKPSRFRRHDTCRGCIRQHTVQFQRATGRASSHDKTVAILIGGTALGIGAEMRLRLIPCQLATAMGPQVYHGRPAARHSDRVTFDLFQNSAFASLRTDRDASDTLAAFDLGNGFAVLDADTKGTRLFRQCSATRCTRVEDHRHIQTRLFQSNRRAIGVIVVGDNNRAVARGHAIINHIVTHSRGQHDARYIVARKRERTFNRTGRRHNLLGADAPQTMTRTIAQRRMIAHTFIAQHIAVVINPCPHHAGADGDVVHGLQLGQQLGNVVRDRRAIDFTTINRRTATPMRGLFHQQNLCTGLACLQSRLQTRNTTTNHHHVHIGVEVFIGVHVTVFRHFAEARRLAHDGFKQVLPGKGREHEGLIVEARREEARHVVVDRAHVELQRRPVVLRRAGQTIKQLGRGGTLVRLELAAFPKVHQSVRLFSTRSHHTTRAVVLEGPAHHHLVIGQQSRGQRVTLIAGEALAVESKVQLFAFVQQTAASCETRAHANSLQLQPGYLAVILSLMSCGGSSVCAL